METSAHLAVLFADVAGSTRLYETLGDREALRIVNCYLDILTQTAVRFDGRLVKTIGDEVLCVFPDAAAVFRAAAEMQLASIPVTEQANAAGIRIGFHTGEVVERDGDVFGDTVNVAARVVALAKAGQVLTTGEAVAAAPSFVRAGARRIDTLAVKGRQTPLELYEVIWRWSEDLTVMVETSDIADLVAGLSGLRLTYKDRQVVLAEEHSSCRLGRDQASDLVVTHPKASRHHARIERRRDKFVLIDQSSNGTYVRFDGEPELILRREELILRGSGDVAFGESVAAIIATLRFEHI